MNYNIIQGKTEYKKKDLAVILSIPRKLQAHPSQTADSIGKFVTNSLKGTEIKPIKLSSDDSQVCRIFEKKNNQGKANIAPEY